MTTKPVRPWSNQTSSRLATLSGLSSGHCARTPFGRLKVSSDIKKAWTSSRLVKKGPSVQYIRSHTMMKSIDEETSATVVESIRVSPGIKRTSTMPDGEALGMVVEAVSVASDIKRASTSLVKKASSVQCCSATTTKPRMLRAPPQLSRGHLHQRPLTMERRLGLRLRSVPRSRPRKDDDSPIPLYFSYAQRNCHR
ncbi:unnamed protein product [Musa hybrid cultivar]